MDKYCLSHLSDGQLLSGLTALVARERTATAEVIAHIAEVDERRLFVPAGYPSMFAYGVQELHFSTDAMYKRITAARAARKFPALFVAVAEGRLHLSGLVELAPHLTPENADDLLTAATHRTRAEIELLLAERFPQPDVATRVQPLAPSPAARHVSSGAADKGASGEVREGQLAPGRVQELQSGTGCVPSHAKEAPLSADRFLLQATISRRAHDHLHYARALLGHAVPSGDLAEVLERALETLVVQLERQKFAATSRPRPQRSSADPRHIPAAVKRAVWERDGGQCSFVGEGGNRCTSCARLEYDHVEPVARGGQATVDGIRLRCRAHNLFEAERVFGAGFMESKREAARQAAAEAKARAAGSEQSEERDVVPWLRKLGFRADEARRAAVRCEAIPDASLEQRLRLALSFLAPPCRVEKCLGAGS